MAQLVKENEALRIAIEQARSYQRELPERARATCTTERDLRLGKPAEASTPPLNASSPPAGADELAAVLLAVHQRPVEFRATDGGSPRLSPGGEASCPKVTTMCA